MTGPRFGMTPKDLYDVTLAGDPRLSPDGKTVAFVVTTVDEEENTYPSAIWLVPADGSAKPRRFTFGKRRDASPRWSPDGTKLAFVSTRDNEKAAQLYVLPVEGGEARQLTDLAESADEITWSPDGTRIAFTSRVRDEAYDADDDRSREPRHIKRLRYRLDSVGWTFDRPRRLFVVPADGSEEPKQLLTGDFEESGPAWSPDSKQIAFSSSRHKDWDVDLVNDIYVVGANGGRPRKVTNTTDGVSLPSWSPDGKHIAYACTPERSGTKHTQIAVDGKILTAHLDRNCSPFMASREPMWLGNDKILFALEEHGNNTLLTTDLNGKTRVVLQGDFRLHGYDGPKVHARSTPTTLPEIFNGTKQLTNFTKTFKPKLVAPKRFTAISEDGSEVEAWVMRPANATKGKRYPALLNIHGGPFTQYGNVFFDEFQVYAAAGYAVVYCNPRGSSGYSEAWGAAINGPKLGGSGWGTVDYDDVIAVIETAVEKFDFIDGRRLGVIGGSYGGYMTSWIVGHTNRFKAAVSERAVNNWHSMNGSSDIGWVFKAQFGTTPWEDPEGWTEMSPITYADKITTPTLVMHSENDLRCPIEQGEQLFTILRQLKRDVEFVRFPAESHELSRSGSPFHRVRRFEIILDWFKRKL